MPTLELQTENNLQYHYYPVAAGSLRIKIRAYKDAHIALTTGPQEESPIYEIIIGGWENKKSVIRKNKTQPEKAEASTPGILSKGEFRVFRIRWDGGNIAVSREGETEPFLQWSDPEPFPISYYGIYTGYGATGTWQIDEGAEFETPDEQEYKFYPVTTGYLDFEYRGASNCQICLTGGPEQNDRVYEFIFTNTKSLIRYNRTDKDTAKTAGILTPDEYKKFIIDWVCGRLVVRLIDYATNKQILEWVDPEPLLPVTHFGVRTGYGARGDWRINHYFDTKPAQLRQAAPSDAALWVDASLGKLPDYATIGGHDTSGEKLYIARAMHEGSMVPGKLVASHQRAYVAWDGKEHEKSSYQVLVDGPTTWVKTSGSKIPARAFPAGESETGEPLFIGRVNHLGSLTIGKVHQSEGKCYIPYGGKEVEFTEYEILVA